MGIECEGGGCRNYMSQVTEHGSVGTILPEKKTEDIVFPSQSFWKRAIHPFGSMNCCNSSPRGMQHCGGGGGTL